MLFYLCTSLLQLAVLLRLPRLHQRWRLEVTACNRLLRLGTTAMLCLGSARTGIPLGATPEGAPSLSNWLQLLRPLLGPPLMLQGHANFLLPFKFVLPAQLLTVAMSALMMQAYVCAIALSKPQLLPLSERACVAMTHAMHNMAVVLGSPPDAAARAYSAECQGVPGLVLLGLYAYVLLLLLVPCLVVYLVELNLKVRFVAGQGARLHLRDTWAIMDSPLIQAVAVFGTVVGGWFVCEGLVAVLAPTACGSGGTGWFAGPALRFS